MTSPEYLTSSLLSQAGFRHAFFCRRGGVSEGPFESLNFSVSVGDREEHVAENLRRAAAVLGVDAERVYFASQVHGCTTQLVDPNVARDAFVQLEADAVLGAAPGLACAVRSADCVPILVGDRASGAALAIHAGWRGVVRGVIASAIERLRATLGGPGDPIAAIGPHLSVARFEVSDDVAEQLRASSPDPDVVDRGHEKPHVDLRRIVRAQLEALGFAPDSIDDVHGCTFQDAERFFSYRRDGARSGRHLSAIVTRG